MGASHAAVAAERVRTYLRAKDDNRPHLMAQVFASDATLEMVVKTDAMVFPERARGREAITDVLVRRFACNYENVYSFCLQRPSGEEALHRFNCDWLVGMSSKSSRELRVGWGRYEWQFQAGAPRLVEGLRITIEAMELLPPHCGEEVFGWLSRLPYPWCEPGLLAEHAPRIDGLQRVLQQAIRASSVAAPCTSVS
ncbi:nuclear transport factor 2 family protein [Ideonella sp. BN130291]|uniref:nuclear transport factor 2 family protein n=1 Tax=Ideonella sp. BN130291 TaxID=3112940 RepID=UPI002E253709|nr:nuclear transport factor 2 family protein [Ideonella sp. BN130291]